MLKTYTRWKYGVTRNDEIKNEFIEEADGVINIYQAKWQKVDRRGLGRLKDDRLNMHIMDVKPPIRRGERSKPRWMDAVYRDVKLVKLERKMAKDRIR